MKKPEELRNILNISVSPVSSGNFRLEMAYRDEQLILERLSRQC
jgi:hypothetical protein